MKNSLLFLFAILLMASCSKQNLNEVPDLGNSNSDNLKVLGNHILYAGQTIDAGIVNYDILTGTGDAPDTLKIEYLCDPGWTISEWHIYAGPLALLPRNKQLTPRIGFFPYAGYPSPATDHVLFKVAMTDFLPEGENYFVIAAHCVLDGPGYQNETGWAIGNGTFNDKRWGWYDDISYWNGDDCPFVITIDQSNGNVVVKETNTVTNEVIERINENLNGTTYDGIAYVINEGIILFVKDGSELYYNDLNDNTPSVLAGTLDGEAASGAYYNGSYYYVNAQDNEIREVFFDENWNRVSEDSIGKIQNDELIVNDIAWNETGDMLYFVGDGISAGNLFVYNTSDGTTGVVTGSELPLGSQIATVINEDVKIVTPSASGFTITTFTVSAGSVVAVDETIIDVGGGDGGIDDAGWF